MQFTCSHLYSISVHFLSCHFNIGKWCHTSDNDFTLHLLRFAPGFVFQFNTRTEVHCGQDGGGPSVVQSTGQQPLQGKEQCNTLASTFKTSHSFCLALIVSCLCPPSCLSGHWVWKKGRACLTLTPPAKTTPVCQDGARWSGAAAVRISDFLSCTTSRIRTLDCSVLMFSD